MTNAKTPGGPADKQATPPHVVNTMQNTDQDAQQEANVEQQENEKRLKAKTEAEAQSVDGKAGQSQKSSHDHMGHIKAGTHEGAGGGAKSKRHH